MNRFVQFASVATLICAPLYAIAQPGDGATRASVKADLVKLEQAGYMPGVDDWRYPANLQAAQERVAGRGVDTSGYGGSISNASQSGTHNGGQSIEN
ncbi:DUF4148 domain-containing protein [Paraburkholderia sp. C35]|uniref:DUF4148 domain-containing protein n=1 Tax=Paraburkholderia sp. C35 TaxID=2126993 RepID=UPI000D695835|nr:DUF4148 domain-containing protein [Paraburkholderia sp. C35]